MKARRVNEEVGLFSSLSCSSYASDSFTDLPSKEWNDSADSGKSLVPDK
jgi:hypothetical protein